MEALWRMTGGVTRRWDFRGGSRRTDWRGPAFTGTAPSRLLLLVLPFQMRFQQFGVVTLHVFKRRGVLFDLPFELKRESLRNRGFDFLFDVVFAFVVGDFRFHHALVHCVLAQD